jgi:hypothetical protein
MVAVRDKPLDPSESKPVGMVAEEGKLIAAHLKWETLFLADCL